MDSTPTRQTREAIMIDVYYWPTPNGHKVTILLEEAGLPYVIKPINIRAGEQYDTRFLAVAPNRRIPAIVDRKPTSSGEPISVFESGAILVYLADKCGKFIPEKPADRYSALQWLFWQMSGLGPMSGQAYYFSSHAERKIPEVITRYLKETRRLYEVLDRQLANRDFIANEYSIADMACYPWVLPHAKLGLRTDDLLNLDNWTKRIGERSAVKRAYALENNFTEEGELSEEARRMLYGSFERK